MFILNSSMNFYKYTIISLLLLQSISSFSQNQMELVRNRIKYQGLEISAKDAKEIAYEVNSPRAYESFSKAKKMNSWNLVWAFVGGWELGSGAVNLAQGYTVGALDMLIGAGLIALPYTGKRKRKYSMYLKSGIEEYNRTLESSK